MLTAFQAETVAYVGDGDVYCVDCVEGENGRFPRVGPEDDGESFYWERAEEAGYTAYSRYSTEDAWPGGIRCGDCDAEIVEPDEDYCRAHDSWREQHGGPDICETFAESEEGSWPRELACEFSADGVAG